MALADYSFLQWSAFGNTGPDYAVAAIIFIGLLAIFYVFRMYGLFLLNRWADRTENDYDDAVIAALKRLRTPFYAALAAYVASHRLVLAPLVQRVVDVLLLVVILYYSVKELGVFIDFFADKQAAKREEEGPSVVYVLAKLAKAFLWLLAFLLLLANLGIEITPLIAGLGVGGIAIAFALQNILEDLFSSFSIYFDKPFKQGDFIVVGGDMGVVKYVGMKTTRLQTLQGQELIISNRELTSTRINNYKRMEKRRVVFSFGLEYSTPADRLRRANEIVREVVSSVDKAELDRTHFKAFGDSALLFEAVYYVDTAEYNIYMDVQQEILLAVHERFGQEGLVMAFPTRTVHVVND